MNGKIISSLSFKYFYQITFYRSSRPKLLCKRGPLKNFAKLTGKHLYWSFFLEACNFITKKLQPQRSFPVNFSKFKKNFFLKHLRTAASVYRRSGYRFSLPSLFIIAIIAYHDPYHYHRSLLL